jgi:ATP-dependent DNA helicase RecG
LDDNYFRNLFIQLSHQPADALENDELEIKGWCSDERQLSEKLADAASCLANAHGGVVLIGVEDGLGPKRFSRCPFPNVSPSWLVARIHDNAHPPVACRAVDVSAEMADARGIADAHAFAILVERKKCLSGHVTSKGICRSRSGKECKPVFAAEDDRTKVVVPDAKMEDLALSSVHWAMAQHKRAFQQAEAFADASDFLSRAGLILSDDESCPGGITLAGLLLFGKEAALKKYAVGCETVVRLPGGSRSLRKNIVESLGDLVLTEHGLLRSGCTTVPDATVRELLVNAYVHRCWRTNGPVSVTLTDTALDIQNPGDLLPGLYVGNLLYGVPLYRNFLLAEGARFAGLCDKIGQGIDVVFKTVLSGGFDFPIFESGNNTFRASIALARSEEFRDFARRRAASLSQLDELVILRYLWAEGESDFKRLSEVLQRGAEIARRVVQSMKSKLMIEVEGGRFRLSDNIRLDIEVPRDSNQLDLFGVA